MGIAKFAEVKRLKELEHKISKNQLLLELSKHPNEKNNNAVQLSLYIGRRGFYEKNELVPFGYNNLQKVLEEMYKEGFLSRTKIEIHDDGIYSRQYPYVYNLIRNIKPEKTSAEEIKEYKKLSVACSDYYIIRNILIIVGSILILGILLAFLNGGDSSKRKYNDLNDVEKENAKWAYEVQQELNN